MKVKLRESVYMPVPTKRFTCVGCVFLSDDRGTCNAPNSIYTSCEHHRQIFHNSQKFFKIFDL